MNESLYVRFIRTSRGRPLARAWIALFGTACLAIGCAPAAPPEQADAATGAPSPPSFTEVSAEAGLDAFRHSTGAFGNRWFPESMGSGGGFVDYDGDGWQDIVLMGGGRWPEHDGGAQGSVRAVHLYRNNGAGAFADVTLETGLVDTASYGIGVAAADYDNDGDTDLYITTLGRNLLYRNDMNEGGIFTEVGLEAGVAGEKRWSSSAIFFDADRDGHLDLYAGNYVDWSPENDLVCMLEGMIRSYCTPELYKGVPATFYHNNGDGTFSDWSEEAGFLPAPGKTLGAAEYDVNRDGWPDLFVANDTQRDLFYLNDGDGTFTEVGALSGMAYDEHGKARAGMGIDVGVVDETGEPTLFVGNFSKEMISAFRYTPDGLFTDRAAVSQIGRSSLTTLTFGLFLLDVDLDTDLDLFALNGHVQPEIGQTQEGIDYAEAPHLFINEGDGLFRDEVQQAGGLNRALVGRGAAYADYDRDGDLDILVTENGGGAHLFRNDLTGGRSVRVRLQGRESNRDGVSASMMAYYGRRPVERNVRTGSSYLSVSEKTVTFGIGASGGIDSLIVSWPSGRVDRFSEGLFPGVEVLIVEGVDALAVQP